ncbi:hypothetical protein [Endozoicomonas montiporae]|nr:hypothetical protein [Endozoicomonas montiporae]AMO55378.1 hypothetical protein EZMO1_1183 [Endozoicomonas montiporae CL-33]
MVDGLKKHYYVTGVTHPLRIIKVSERGHCSVALIPSFKVRNISYVISPIRMVNTGLPIPLPINPPSPKGSSQQVSGSSQDKDTEQSNEEPQTSGSAYGRKISTKSVDSELSGAMSRASLSSSSSSDSVFSDVPNITDHDITVMDEGIETPVPNPQVQHLRGGKRSRGGSSSSTESVSGRLRRFKKLKHNQDFKSSSPLSVGAEGTKRKENREKKRALAEQKKLLELSEEELKERPSVTEALRTKLLAADQQELTTWSHQVNQSLGEAESRLKAAGAHDITTDRKLDYYFRIYQFNSNDISLLRHLQAFGKDRIRDHLAPKICQDIIEEQGYVSGSQCDELANRNRITRHEAQQARQQYLFDADPDVSADILTGNLHRLIGRPYGLRKELNQLEKQLGETGFQLKNLTQRSKITAFRKKSETLQVVKPVVISCL